jgi:hypothetical protein
MSFNPYADESFWKAVAAESVERRAHPRQFATEALDSIFADTWTVEEAMSGFRRKVAEFPWWAEDALACIDAIMAEDDQTLQEIAKEAHLPLGGVAARDWLVPRLAQLHATFDDEVQRQQQIRASKSHLEND